MNKSSWPRANPHDAQAARRIGAEGIGLCRTEHMFFAEGRIEHMQAMILARDEKSRRKAVQKIKMAVELGRKTNPKLEIGICGEHGGEPSSVQFCYRIGMNYVSCSPYRVPIARLAAAQAAISGDKSETQRTA
jgi:phosphoenolpyruvate synthase/pyruvate phosphate dikinase